MRRVLMLPVLFAALALAQTAGPEEEVRKAEKAWAAAVVARDYAALDRIFCDQLIYAHSTGAVEDKNEYVARLRKGAQRYDELSHEKMTVKIHGDAAVVHAHVRMKGLSNGRPFDDRLMMLHLWVNHGGSAWRLAAHQTTKLE